MLINHTVSFSKSKSSKDPLYCPVLPLPFHMKWFGSAPKLGRMVFTNRGPQVKGASRASCLSFLKKNLASKKEKEKIDRIQFFHKE